MRRKVKGVKMNVAFWRVYLSFVIVVPVIFLHIFFDCVRKDKVWFYIQASLSTFQFFVSGNHFLSGWKKGGTSLYYFIQISYCYLISVYLSFNSYLPTFLRIKDFESSVHFFAMSTVIISFNNFLWLASSTYYLSSTSHLLKSIEKTQSNILKLKMNDIISVDKNEYVPCEGIIRKGKSIIDESYNGLYTKTSGLIEKSVGDEVLPLSLVKSERIIVQINEDGDKGAKEIVKRLLLKTYFEENLITKSIRDIQKYAIFALFVVIFLFFALWYVVVVVILRDYSDYYRKLTVNQTLETLIEGTVSMLCIFYPFGYLDLGMKVLSGAAASHGILIKGSRFFQTHTNKLTLFVDFDTIFFFDSLTTTPDPKEDSGSVKPEKKRLRFPFEIYSFRWMIEESRDSSDSVATKHSLILKDENVVKNKILCVLRRCAKFGRKKRYGFRFSDILVEYLLHTTNGQLPRLIDIQKEEGDDDGENDDDFDEGDVKVLEMRPFGFSVDGVTETVDPAQWNQKEDAKCTSKHDDDDNNNNNNNNNSNGEDVMKYNLIVGDLEYIREKGVELVVENMRTKFDPKDEERIHEFGMKQVFIILDGKYLLGHCLMMPRIRRLQEYELFLKYSNLSVFRNIIRTRFISHIFTVNQIMNIIQHHIKNTSNILDDGEDRKQEEIHFSNGCDTTYHDIERREKFLKLVREEDWVKSCGSKKLQRLSGFREIILSAVEKGKRKNLNQKEEDQEEEEEEEEEEISSFNIVDDDDDDDLEEEEEEEQVNEQDLTIKKRSRSELIFLTHGECVSHYHTISLPLCDVGKLFHACYSQNIGKHSQFTEKLCGAVLLDNSPCKIFALSDIVKYQYYKTINTVFNGIYYNLFTIFFLFFGSFFVLGRPVPPLLSGVISFGIGVWFILGLTEIMTYEMRDLEENDSGDEHVDERKTKAKVE